MEKLNIILSPHFDDAVLSLGGLLVKEGSQSVVATCFTGTPTKALVRSWDLASGFRNSDAAMEARTTENQDALRLLGVKDEHVINYPNLDRQYRGWRSFLGFAESELETQLKNQIELLLDRYRSFPVRIYAPGLEIHRDHGLLKQAFLEMFRSGKYPDVEYFLYQDLPYACDILKKHPQIVLISRITKGTLKVQADYVSLTADEMQQKIAAVKIYASQLRPLGTDLCQTLEDFAHAQAKYLGTDGYVEVVYRLVT